MIMQPADIRAIARHQHLRGVELVELRKGDDRVRIVISAGVSRGTAGESSNAMNGSSAQVPEAETAGASNVIVKAEALGFLRRSHPMRAPARVVESGDSVVKGQPLALLQVGEAYSSVVASCDGIVESVLVTEGERVDFGKALFSVKPKAP